VTRARGGTVSGVTLADPAPGHVRSRAHGHRHARRGQRRRHDAVDPHSRDGCVQSGPPLDPTGAGTADDQRGGALRASPRSRSGVHRRLLGPTRLRSLAAESHAGSRDQPGPDARRHGRSARASVGPVRRQVVRGGVLAGRDARRVRSGSRTTMRSAPPGCGASSTRSSSSRRSVPRRM
jgi:hypothetical protein